MNSICRSGQPKIPIFWHLCGVNSYRVRKLPLFTSPRLAKFAYSVRCSWMKLELRCSTDDRQECISVLPEECFAIFKSHFYWQEVLYGNSELISGYKWLNSLKESIASTTACTITEGEVHRCNITFETSNLYLNLLPWKNESQKRQEHQTKECTTSTFAWITQIPREGSNPPSAPANPERRPFTLQSVSSQKFAYKISTAVKRPSTTASNPKSNYTSARRN